MLWNSRISFRQPHKKEPKALTQDVYVKSSPIFHNRVSSIVASLRSAAELNAVAQDIYDLPFDFITPLRY